MSGTEDLSINWGPQPDTGDPEIHIYTDGDIRINAAAGRQYFSGAEETDVGADPDAGLLVFDPTGERNPLQIAREGNEVGGEVAGASRTKQLLDLDRLDEPLHIPLEERGDLLVADVEAVLVEDAAEDVATNEGDEQDDDGLPLLDEYHSSQPLVEEYLLEALSRGEREFTSAEIGDVMGAELTGQQIGGALRALKNSDDSPFVVGKADAEGDAATWRVELDSELAAKLGEPSSAEASADEPLSVEAAADRVDSVQELADELGIGEGAARRKAMDADVYSNLQDNVKRPGVRD